MYKTELHCHSAEVSSCANAKAETVVERYVSQGYTTLVLTNHLSQKTFQGHPELDTWEKKLNFFFDGVRKLEAAAGSKLSILYGVEIRMNDDPNDYLIYGESRSFLYENPDLLDIALPELVARTRKAGLLLVQAHPFRNDMNIVRPDLLDGMEVFNSHKSHVSRNDIAFQWACRYNLIMTSGSDLHDPDNFIGGGIRTPFPLTDNDMLVRVLKSRMYELIREGNLA